MERLVGRSYTTQKGFEMTELDQLMKRIDKSGLDGVETAMIRRTGYGQSIN